MNENRASYENPLDAIAAAETLVKHHNKAYRVEATPDAFYVVETTEPRVGVICEVIYPSERQRKEEEEKGKILPIGWQCPACGMGNAPTVSRCHCLLYKNAPKK